MCVCVCARAQQRGPESPTIMITWNTAASKDTITDIMTPFFVCVFVVFRFFVCVCVFVLCTSRINNFCQFFFFFIWTVCVKWLHFPNLPQNSIKKLGNKLILFEIAKTNNEMRSSVHFEHFRMAWGEFVQTGTFDERHYTTVVSLV